MFRRGLHALRSSSRLRPYRPAAAWPATTSGRPRGLTVHAADLQFGQPLHETHPHLLGPGEVTPGISALEYAHRRARLAQALPPDSVAIVAASDVKFRSGAVFYEFHQDSDFYYLTGFNEPEALAVIERTGAGADHVFHLYVRPKDPKAELWEGARSGVEAAQDVFNADETGSITQIHNILPDVVRRAGAIYTDLPGSNLPKTRFIQYLTGSKSHWKGDFPQLLQDAGASSVKPLRPVLNEIRVFKSEAEIANMRKAGQASGRAFTEAMRNSFQSEKDLHAFLDYRFKMLGCDAPAYVPVIAGGQNALSIHYVRNDSLLGNGDLVLVDAGGECGGYITDITRTWPNSGKFTDAQRDLYEAVLKTQRSCVSLCREDAHMSLNQLHRVAEAGLKGSLSDLGFDMSRDALPVLFPHHLGHYIGLDVHDTPGYPRSGVLKKGQCITIEPGIYVPDDDRWPVHFRGLGIRIEDSVCVQQESPLILTTEAVKEVADIEALRG